MFCDHRFMIKCVSFGLDGVVILITPSGEYTLRIPNCLIKLQVIMLCFDCLAIVWWILMIRRMWIMKLFVTWIKWFEIVYELLNLRIWKPCIVSDKAYMKCKCLMKLLVFKERGNCEFKLRGVLNDGFLNKTIAPCSRWSRFKL